MIRYSAGIEMTLQASRVRCAAPEAAIVPTGVGLEGLRAELAGRQSQRDLLQHRLDTFKAGHRAGVAQCKPLAGG